MLTFFSFSDYLDLSPGTSGATISWIPYDSGISIALGSSPSSNSPNTLYHVIIVSGVIVHCGFIGNSTGMISNALSRMSYSTLWLNGLSFAKLKVWMNMEFSSSHVLVSLCNSIETYHLCGISSSVWTNMWTHSSFGIFSICLACYRVISWITSSIIKLTFEVFLLPESKFHPSSEYFLFFYRCFVCISTSCWGSLKCFF